jgi:cell fate regulator YaaT (PSP1 superfamily)
VRFAQGGLIDEFDGGEDYYRKGDAIIVETDKGLQLGEVVQPSRRAMRSVERLPRVIRRMTANDGRQEQRNQGKETQAFKLCQELSHDLGLPLKLISVDYLHGGNRAIFYFSAEGRIDFRQLVRELAARLHTRIEMRQVGVRDASRHVGGIGPCGQQLCCSAFLQRFAPVSIRMAKDQNLVLNPQKVSGVCGRLMCCLTYEQKGYESLRQGLPKAGKRVRLANGKEGKVRELDVLRRRFKVQLEDGVMVVATPEELAPRETPHQTSRKEERPRDQDGGR